MELAQVELEVDVLLVTDGVAAGDLIFCDACVPGSE